MTDAKHLALWFSSKLGQRILQMQRKSLSVVLPRCFGHYALHISPVPLSIPTFPAVTRCYALVGQGQLPGVSISSVLPSVQAIMVDVHALPFESESINAILLHHTLDIYENPHQLLREVERVLVPGGRLILIGFNPWSWWGITRRFLRLIAPLMPSSLVQQCCHYWPLQSRYLSRFRLRDWLQLLNFDTEDGYQLTFNCAVVKAPFWNESLNRFCEQFASTYMLSGVKRVSCITPIKLQWRGIDNRFSVAPITMTRIQRFYQHTHHNNNQ